MGRGDVDEAMVRLDFVPFHSLFPSDIPGQRRSRCAFEGFHRENMSSVTIVLDSFSLIRCPSTFSMFSVVFIRV